jgi:hypothetical protein
MTTADKLLVSMLPLENGDRPVFKKGAKIVMAAQLPKVTKNSTLYDEDYCLWLKTTAKSARKNNILIWFDKIVPLTVEGVFM